MRGLATVTMVSVFTLTAVAPAMAQQLNPCAAKNPAGQKAQNPCRAKNPCASKNPCAAKAPSASPGILTAVKGPNERDARFGAGPTLRPPEAR
jgi:hypothetical protein